MRARVRVCCVADLASRRGDLAQVPLGLILLRLSDRRTQHTWKYAHDRKTTYTGRGLLIGRQYQTRAVTREGSKIVSLRFAFLVFSLVFFFSPSPGLLL